MIIFYANSGFKLNLTNLKITFIEENALFYDAFFKNYTLPFNLDVDDETSIKLGLIDEENITDYNVKHQGVIFLDNKFEIAYLLIEVLEESIEATISFGKITLPLMDTDLNALPFPIVKNSYVTSFANSIKNKVYPEVTHAFPMVFDDEFSKETNYDFFEGIINNYNGTTYVTNSIDGTTGDVQNKNIMVPFPFLMGILKLGFASANMQMIGEFVNSKANNHIILDPKNHLENFSSNTYETYQFSQTTEEYIDGEVLIYGYQKTHQLTSIGSFNIKVFLNLPNEVTVRSLEIKRGSTVLFSEAGNSIDETITINKEAAVPFETITVKLEIEATTVLIENFNNFEFEKSEGKLNTFKNAYSLAEFMPDMTFGSLLAKVKNWLNLKVIMSDNYVRLDYIENKFTEVNFKDERPFEIKTPKRVFNQNKLYKLKYSDDNYLLIDKKGLTNSTASFRDEDIIEIDIDLQILPVEERENIFSALRFKEDVFSIALYNGVDVNGYPVIVDNIEGTTFLLPEVYGVRWKNWLNFRLNSETYTDKFTAHALDEFLIDEGRFKYNKKHIYKTIKRTRISEEQWQFEIESETF